MYKNEGFSLIELMIVVGIIGILALIGMPIYDNYVMRVKLSELNFEIMGKYRYLQTELMSAGEKGAAFNIAADLCDPNTITTRKGGYGDDIFECDMRPNTSLFPVTTKLTTYSGHYQKDDSVVYLHYEEEAAGKQVWMRIQADPESASFNIMIPPEIVHKYVGNRANKSWYKTFRINMWRHGFADLGRFEDNENVAGFVGKVIEKGETKVTRTKAGKWYCAYMSVEPYYYIPPIQARPSGCKSTYLLNEGLIIEE